MIFKKKNNKNVKNGKNIFGVSKNFKKAIYRVIN